MENNFQLDFDAVNKVLRLSIHGEVTDQLLLDGYAVLSECLVRFGPYRCIVDYTEATNFKISSAGVVHLAGKSPIFPIDCATLNVAPR
jgi:hypothetical protein